MAANRHNVFCVVALGLGITTFGGCSNAEKPPTEQGTVTLTVAPKDVPKDQKAVNAKNVAPQDQKSGTLNFNVVAPKEQK